MERGSPTMTGRPHDTPVNSSPAVAENAEGEEIDVLESTDVLPVPQEDVSLTSNAADLLHSGSRTFTFLLQWSRLCLLIVRSRTKHEPSINGGSFTLITKGIKKGCVT